MNTATKKETPNDIIFQLVRSINMNSRKDFYHVAERYQKSLSPSGTTYNELYRLLKQRPLEIVNLENLGKDLASLIRPVQFELEEVFLTVELQALIKDLKAEITHKELFKQHNLSIRNKILFYGTTGNGKTTLARYISKCLGLPFVEINGDIIDSKMGSTSSRITQIFNSLNAPCVLFWDEVDSIGNERKGGDSALEQENNRIVNTFLSQFEKLHEDVVFIAATNRFDSLDPAFKRRFEVRMEIKNPSVEEKGEFLKKLMDHYNFTPEHKSIAWIKLHALDTYAEIKEYCVEVARKIVLQKIQNLEPETI
jgi:SpoVK/Ycf46/Vps4 family AAA+-type ATPase